jgi:chitin disaccharide deacetylase
MSAGTEAVRRRLSLSADDYGIAPGVGRAIRSLAENARLNATSCMSGSPFWPDEAALLKNSVLPGFAVGLHLVLSDQPSLIRAAGLAPDGKLPALPGLILRAVSRRLDPAEVAAELTAQIDRFEEFWGAPPAFLDGHHHVHQLPVIRDVVLDLCTTRLAGSNVWLRRCTQPFPRIIRTGTAIRRAALISALGWHFDHLATKAGVPGNRHLAGVRDFTGEPAYADLMRRWLVHATPGTLIMCHPGWVDEALGAADSLTAPREEEYRFLASDGFQALLDEYRITLCPPQDLFRQK